MRRRRNDLLPGKRSDVIPKLRQQKHVRNQAKLHAPACAESDLRTSFEVRLAICGNGSGPPMMYSLALAPPAGKGRQRCSRLLSETTGPVSARRTDPVYRTSDQAPEGKDGRHDKGNETPPRRISKGCLPARCRPRSDSEYPPARRSMTPKHFIAVF
jgi:hypothetical protein